MIWIPLCVIVLALLGFGWWRHRKMKNNPLYEKAKWGAGFHKPDFRPPRKS
jgi:hypothetical protein